MTEVNKPTTGRKSNLKLALILASVSATFFVGFVLKMTMLAHH